MSTCLMRLPSGRDGSWITRTLSDRPRARNVRSAPAGCHCCSSTALSSPAGQLDQPHVVHERQHPVGLGVGDHAVGVGRVGGRVALEVQLVAQAARVHDADVGLALVGGDAVAQGVGDQVAEGRLLLTGVALTAGVRAVGVGAALERGGDVAGDLADRLVAHDLGRGQRRVDGGLDGLELRAVRRVGDQVGVARRHARGVARGGVGDLAGVLVVGQHDLADVRAVRARLHHRTCRLVAAGHRLVVDVLLVRVPVEDRVDVGVEVRHLRELAARGQRLGVARGRRWSRRGSSPPGRLPRRWRCCRR